ncbi:hypothetical protein CEUSTIGMA_g624.t1 [Chlamydomonas eustigma]|uniref:Uncharacterized protein n=1 Tax=Chlamydomonas eustigma TaxID=1157962 RepID=A0A250WQV1_9CHLO|nr:hypothetical protein CEUSTIGMA_g624.t1 [Chlamydomonas eustigma]|eukprot:GAX73171.1 hypothetical protein CEUSTIGMA_g624.t1 [Chlamydomonas eustigma]
MSSSDELLLALLLAILVTGSLASTSPPAPAVSPAIPIVHPPPTYRAVPSFPPPYPPPPTPTSLGYARFFGPLSFGCKAYQASHFSSPTPVYGGTTIAMQQNGWATVTIPMAGGTYGTGIPMAGGSYGTGDYPFPPSTTCSDQVLGLPIPFSLVAQVPPYKLPSTTMQGFGVSSTTTFSEGASNNTLLSATALYSVITGSKDLAGIPDTSVFSKARGSTLAAAQQVLLADVISATHLMLIGKFLTQVVPQLCLPGNGYGGTALSLTASDMDQQVTRVATTILSSASLAPAYSVAAPQNSSYVTNTSSRPGNTSATLVAPNSTSYTLTATYPLNSTDYASVQTLITQSMLAAGCSTLLVKIAVVQSSVTALAKTISAVAATATDYSNALTQFPIQQALAMASTTFAVQANILPLLAGTVTDITKDPAQLSPILNDPTVLTSYIQVANISTAAVLSAMGVPYTSDALVPAAVQAAAYGAGPLQSCMYTVPAGCSDYLLLINSRLSYTVALPAASSYSTAYLGSGAALATAAYLSNQTSAPSLPTLSMYNQLYDGVLGKVTGYNYLTQSGGAVPFLSSPAQLAAFAIDGMISSVVACASALVSAAFLGVSPSGSSSQYSPLLLTGTYQAQMYAMLSSTLAPAKVNMITFQGLYNNASAIQAAIVDLYLEVYVTQLLNQSSATRRQLLGLMLGTAEEQIMFYEDVEDLDVDAKDNLATDSVIHHRATSRFLASSIFSATQIGTLISSLSAALFESNNILQTVIQPAFNAILEGDLVGNTLNVSHYMNLAAKTEKVQLGILADAAEALGMAIAAGNVAQAQSISAAIQQNFTGTNLNAAVFNAVINPAALPLPCSGAAALTSGCSGTLSPPPGQGGITTPESKSMNKTLALGIGLGLGLAALSVAATAAVLLIRRKRKVQVVTPKADPAASSSASGNFLTHQPPPWENMDAPPSPSPYSLQGAPPSPYGRVTALPISPYPALGVDGYGAVPQPMSPGGSSYPPLQNADWGSSPRPWAFGLPVTASSTMGVLSAPPSPARDQIRQAQQQQQLARQILVSSSTDPNAAAGSPRPPWANSSLRQPLPPIPGSPSRSRLQISSLPLTPSISRTQLAPLEVRTSSQELGAAATLVGPYGTPVPASSLQGAGSASLMSSLGRSSSLVTPSGVQMAAAATVDTPLSPTASRTVEAVMTPQGRLAAAYGPPRPPLGVELPPSPK